MVHKFAPFIRRVQIKKPTIIQPELADKTRTTTRSPIQMLEHKPMEIVAVHARMVRNVFLNVEIFLNDGIRELSEYDLQGMMFLFFRAALANTRARADRERNGKVDCVIYDGVTPSVFYEMKTYFKKHEKLQKKGFDHDIEKLGKQLKKYPGTRGFFFVAGAKGKFTDTALQQFPFIKDCLSQKRGWVKYPLTTGGSLRLRPSQKQHQGRSVVITWEVKV